MTLLNKQSSSLSDYLREEDGKTVKKWLLLASLGLVASAFLANNTNANHSSSDNTVVNVGSGHVSGGHCSAHANHYNHSSY